MLLYVGNTAISAASMHITRREWDRIALKPVSNVCTDVAGECRTASLAVGASRQVALFPPSRCSRRLAYADYLASVEASACKKIGHWYVHRIGLPEAERGVLRALCVLKYAGVCAVQHADHTNEMACRG